MKNIKYTVTHPIFVFMKKHFCPHCKAALTVETAHHLVNSRSEEAKNYDFSTEDGRMIGTVDFRNPYFFLPELPCGVFGGRIVEKGEGKKGKQITQEN